MISTAVRLNLVRKICPKCGRGMMHIRRACCAERKRGIKAYLKCTRCGHRETI